MYLNTTSEVMIYEQAFVFPYGVSTMATTSTKYGIATKDIISKDALANLFSMLYVTHVFKQVANDRGQVVALPRRIFDPRRPKRKPTTEEMEEYLIQYDPLIPNDPRRVISHKYRVSYFDWDWLGDYLYLNACFPQIENSRQIITSPALLESTSLVFAYGLDLFSSRVAPSGTFDILSENFNKAQLVLTVAGLAGAIFITKPMVRKKKLRERWYSSSTLR